MPPLTPEQKALRQSFIGGSDAPSICGVNPYRTAYDVFLEKTGKGKAIRETEAMYWGTIHEDAIARRYGEISGREVLLVPDTVQHPTHSFIACHVDRGLRDPRLSEKGVLECKTTRKALKKGECPEWYVIQLYHNMLCVGATWGVVAILIQGSELVHYEYHLTKPIEHAILTLERKFWDAVQQKKWEIFGCE